ncbi:chorismate mutase 2 isoform X1 [Rhodamnia argentea]|uniref:Chorismate mutase n=1 Tax=Rhodamnia argentea TaxID=178133 RepID=A0A8B8Q081_9MYRT|nr:chorismate mutase 2 isoform X1 [Rhodamnia argentea]XP_048139905.1 chorismate mutase 2 isoform X1 [Rhodamnia argentea]
MEVAESNEMTLETVRDSLIRQEDTIIFSLIERTKYPINVGAYDKTKTAVSECSDSLVEFMVKETEAAYAKCGRYENPEEHPFFPDGLPTSLVPAFNYPKILHPAAASINVNSTIWEVYFSQLLPLITVPGDDGNYATSAVSDLACLQALSRRIHYGKFVAEVKFKDAPKKYESAICSQDRDALMKLLTFETVEERVKKRVAKKAMLFGQEVSLDDNYDEKKLKIDPAIVSRLYEEWVMPLTKLVEVEYLLRRLD